MKPALLRSRTAVAILLAALLALTLFVDFAVNGLGPAAADSVHSGSAINPEILMLPPAPGPPVEAEPLAVAWDFDGTGLSVVPAGRRVVWRNLGRQPHTITAKDGSFDSGVLAPGDTWSRTFATPGIYPYHCQLHPSLTGLIIVQ